MKNIITFTTLISMLMLLGCTTTASLYPVEGPFSEIRPLPVITATADGISGNSGNISLTLPDGEFCEGRWSSISPMSVGYSSATASGTATNGMDTVWATVYGSGYSIRNHPGVNKGEAMLVCNQGNVIHIEFYTGSGTANGTGVAKDKKGNIFRVLI